MCIKCRVDYVVHIIMDYDSSSRLYFSCTFTFWHKVVILGFPSPDLYCCSSQMLIINSIAASNIMTSSFSWYISFGRILLHLELYSTHDPFNVHLEICWFSLHLKLVVDLPFCKCWYLVYLYYEFLSIQQQLTLHH